MGMRAGVGLSTRPDTRAAVREAVARAREGAGLDRAAWAACFFSMAHLPRADLVQETVLAETGCAALFGCSAMGLVAAGEEVEGRAGLAVMVGEAPGMEARSALLPATGEGAGSLVPGDGPGVLLALPDAYRVDAGDWLASLYRQRPALPVYGAGATDNGTTGMSLQLGLEGVQSGSVAALGLSGETMEVAVGITQSCTPAGDARFITRAEGNVLLELDGRPAIHAYIEQGQKLGVEDFQELVQQLLLGFPLDSESPSFAGDACLVRHLIGFDQRTGGLMVPDDLAHQRAMVFMQRNARQAERDMHRMTAGLRERLSGPPDFGLYFDCAARGRRLYGREGVDSEVIRRELGEFPLIGMLGGFEMATTVGLPLMYTYTGVLVLVRHRAG